MLKVCFFGQPRFYVDGLPFKFAASPKALQLLAYLLLNRAAPVRRDSIAFTLWLDDTEDDARTDLRRHLNYLKNALPPVPAERPWVVADLETAQWNPEADCVFDVAEFERLAASPIDRAAAIDVYTGELLESSYDDWLFVRREQLRTLYLTVLDELLQESRSRRDLQQAVTYAQKIMAAEPWRENTLRQLLAVRYEAGDRAGALGVFEQFRRRLREEMSVDPMPETLALRDLILRNAPLPESQLAVSNATRADGSAPPLLPFIGRENEMEQLGALWSRAARGHGSTVLIGGQAGIGKSRLASELALRAAAQGGRIVAGTTSSPESVPYEAIAQAFRVAAPPFSALDVEPAWLSAVAQIVPQVRDVRADLPALPSLAPERERSRLFEAMSCCLDSFARSRPALLIIEDLHWASSATIAALGYLARNIGGSSILVVGTYREDEIGAGHPLGGLRRELQRESMLTHIGLAALAETSVRDLVRALPELDSFDRDAAERAAIQSRGNPLFLTAILRNFIEAAPEEIHALPRGLKDMILARFARFSEAARFLARVASVVGAAFDIETVRDLSGWNEHEVLDAIDELLRFQVVRESVSRSAFHFAFSHHLVQHAIYDEISAVERMRWHRRAANAIERIHEARIDETSAILARHFDLGGEPARAATYYLRAARNALALYANDAALALTARGLEVTSDSQERLDLLALCETIYGRQGRRAEQKLALDELERAAVAAGRDVLICDSIERRIRLHRALGERDEERASIDALASCALATGDMRWTARAAQERGRYLVSVGTPAEARSSIGAALAAYRELGDTRGEAECLCIIAYADAISLKTVEGEQAMERAQALADADGNQELIAQTYYTASSVALAVEEYSLSGTFAERALERYRAIGDREGEADAAVRLGVVAARTFDIGAARTWYAKAAASYAAVGKKQGIGSVKLNGALLEFAVGRVDRSREACLEAERIFSELGDVLGTTISAINLAMANYYRGDQTAAKDLALRALELARKMGSAPLEAAALSNLGAVERELGEFAESLEHLEASIALRKQSGAVADISLDTAELVLTHLKLDHTADAQRLADELMALNPSEYATTWAPQTVPLAAALAYRALRKKKRADEAIDLARRLFRERVARLPDAEGRTTYENISFNRELARW